VSCPFVYSDGAYVLGALSPAERTGYEAHLAGCESCGAAVARLAPMPGLLGRVDPAALEPSRSPSPTRLVNLIEAVTRQRRRWTRQRRWQLAAVAAVTAGLVSAGGVVWSGLAGGDTGGGPPAPAVVMEPVAQAAPITAQVAFWPEAGGTGVWMACQYSPVAYQAPASTFRLVAVGPDGASEQLGSWRAAPGDQVVLSGLTRFSRDELVRIELHSSGGAVLLSHDVSAG
jgi:hypothetical protein